MPLPILDIPRFKCDIPSTGQNISFRPFLVKEEKILYMALESGEESDMLDATKKILNTCVESDLDIDKLSNFDLEYLFLQLRSKSVSEVIELKLKHDTEECGHFSTVEIDIRDIQVEGIDKDKTNVMVKDDLGFKMAYPSLDMINVARTQSSEMNKSFALILECVEFIFDNEQVYDDFTKDELREFIEHLTDEQFEKLISFFNSSPTLRHTINFKCEECKEETEQTIEGLSNFFF